MTLTAGGCTDIGPRALNQDGLDWDIGLGFFVVADGMGGHNAGEVASHLAVQAVRDFVTESAAGTDLAWPFSYDPALSVDGNRLLTAVRLANRRIYQEGCAHAAFDGMGTTVVAVLARDERAVMVSVGDSRIYRWRDSVLTQLTSDDTWLSTVMGLADDDRQGASHPLKHVLTSVVGTREDVRPTVLEERLLPGDRLVLCSDGVHGRLDSQAIAAILCQGAPPERQAEALVLEALIRHTSDNATALVVVAE